MIKVDELVGAELDGWVAKGCRMDGHILTEGVPGNYTRREFRVKPDNVAFRPSTSWSDGGPVIERGRITIAAVGKREPSWFAEIGGAKFDTGVEVGVGEYSAEGPTALIAAMRAFVRSKFGDEVPGEPFDPRN